MRITKLGHCCLLIEERGLRILTDPGSYSAAQNSLSEIDIILITQEHADHLDMDSLAQIMQLSPHARVLAVEGARKILAPAGIFFELTGDGYRLEEKGVSIEGYGRFHAEIYSEIPIVDNTGYLIAGRFFYPGDAFVIPAHPVEILALPVAGPWMKIAEAIDYARALRPRAAFPVHDGMLKIPKPTYMLAERLLKPAGIDFKVIENGSAAVF